ncbi:MAG: biopolymer transporter ExbD [Planctomycetes bacterium]|nr:biopolymer transporter ExbD [Planctomycetota bacterium]
MRVPRQNQRSEIGINMTPMIDVVFQLLIFFLVSSHIAKQEAQMPLPLPIADSGTDDEESQRPRVTINLLPDDQLLMAGKPIVAGQLPERLRDVVGREGRDVEIRIRCDRRVAYRNVEPILMGCAQAGIWNVAFAVYHSKDATR